MTLITDSAITGSLDVKDAEDLVERLQRLIAYAKRDAEFVPGGLYLDQHGTAYLAVDNPLGAAGEVQLWRLTSRAQMAEPSWWRSAKSAEFRPLTAACGCVLTATGTEAHL